MDTGDIGAQLRSSRESLGLSLASLAQRTRIQLRIITAIENNDIASIPPKPYGRAFVRAYAREAGLDPDQTVHDYFARFASTVPDDEDRQQQPEPWPARQAWLVPAAGMFAVALVALAVFRGNTSDATDRNLAAPVGTSGRAGERAVDTPRPDAPIGTADQIADSRGASPRDANSRGSASISIVLLADRECWVTASADGERVLYQLMQPGTQHTIRADREVTLRAGDAGALRLTVNGREAGAFGENGQVRNARVTPDTAASLGGGR
jgi:cytoskeletal protein RodZ